MLVKVVYFLCCEHCVSKDCPREEGHATSCAVYYCMTGKTKKE